MIRCSEKNRMKQINGGKNVLFKFMEMARDINGCIQICAQTNKLIAQRLA